jgi:rod shape determining protein RodA
MDLAPPPIVMISSKLKQDILLIRRMDTLSLLLHGVLLGIGVLFIRGAGLDVGGIMAEMWQRQLVWIGVGSLIYLGCALFDYRWLGRHAWMPYLGGLGILVLLLLLNRSINSSRSWLVIPGFGMLQPSELMKPVVLLFMCWTYTHPVLRHSRMPPWLLPLAILALPLLLIFMQPDYGTALVYMPFAFMLLFVDGLKWRNVLLASLAALLLFPLSFRVLRPHQQDRLKVFLEVPSHFAMAAVAPLLNDSQRERLGEAQKKFFLKADGRPFDNWNAQQSLLAVGSGGFMGKGYLKGTQYVLGYLPKTVAPTDFIFSVIAEEIGFVGSACVVCLLICLILCSCRTAILAADELGSFLAVGIAAIFATHTFINIGMTIQAAPIIGIPLPFVSYGGSFMFGSMMLAGLGQSVHMRRGMTEEA